MFKKLSACFRNAAGLKDFFGAMGDILTGFEDSEEPAKNGFEKDAESIRSYFVAVEREMLSAMSSAGLHTITRADEEKSGQ